MILTKPGDVWSLIPVFSFKGELLRCVFHCVVSLVKCLVVWSKKLYLMSFSSYINYAISECTLDGGYFLKIR
jgi:hypothetical protein